MLPPPQAEKNPNGVESIPNAAMIREQLRRVLAHPLFTNSKRYPVLLAYTVEQALKGNSSELKERTIGVEAFGREPDYDVNVDPVVRITAAEVRKRLIQYYYNPNHAGELVIELPVGSYVPSFREANPSQNGTTSETHFSHPRETPARVLVSPAVAAAQTAPASLRLTARHWTSIAAALFLVALLGFGVGRIHYPAQPSNLERFWEPITATPNRVTYCLGEPGHSVDLAGNPVGQTRWNGSLDVSDVITLARSIVPLVPRNRAFRVVGAFDTEFTQLREGPFVLIGAFDNIWTMRITQDLPFGFEYDSDSHVRRVVDRQSPQKRSWTLQLHFPTTKLDQDYALVARIHDTVTGQPVIILAGILGEGTEAAGELVSNPSYLDALLQKAPKNWDERNLEAVIETHVIDQHPGPPEVIAVQTW